MEFIPEEWAPHIREHYVQYVAAALHRLHGVPMDEARRRALEASYRAHPPTECEKGRPPS